MNSFRSLIVSAAVLISCIPAFSNFTGIIDDQIGAAVPVSKRLRVEHYDLRVKAQGFKPLTGMLKIGLKISIAQRFGST
jgi:hypothetical protein